MAEPTPPTPDRTAPATPAAAHTLSYASEPRVRVTGRHVRWALLWLGAFLVFTGLLLNPLIELDRRLGTGIWGTPAAPVQVGGDTYTMAIYGLEAAGYAGLFLLSQALFLLPRGRLSFRTSEVGRPMRRAAAGAACAAMLLTTGLVATLLEWMPGGWGRLTLASPADGTQHFGPVWASMLVLWAVWAAVFHHLWRNLDHRTAVSRATRALLAGTVVELLVAVPVHAWATRRVGDDCYCARGSYTGLVFGGTVLFWLFGPGVLLLALRERKRFSGGDDQVGR